MSRPIDSSNRQLSHPLRAAVKHKSGIAEPIVDESLPPSTSPPPPPPPPPPPSTSSSSTAFFFRSSKAPRVATGNNGKLGPAAHE
jgi:hypothetical protein